METVVQFHVADITKPAFYDYCYNETQHTNTLTCIHPCRSWSSSSSAPAATPTTSSRHCEFFGRFSQVCFILSLVHYIIPYTTHKVSLLFHFTLWLWFSFLCVWVNVREPNWELWMCLQNTEWCVCLRMVFMMMMTKTELIKRPFCWVSSWYMLGWSRVYKVGRSHALDFCVGVTVFRSLTVQYRIQIHNAFMTFPSLLVLVMLTNFLRKKMCKQCIQLYLHFTNNIQCREVYKRLLYAV